VLRDPLWLLAAPVVGYGFAVSVRASTHSGGPMTAGESPYISRRASRDAAAANRCLWLS
jgi:hypothetical protein